MHVFVLYCHDKEQHMGTHSVMHGEGVGNWNGT